ncbi:type II 3-dehydroquinate dehydratase [Terribacillus saccharophilus]|uniref:type II 3-dehydroquinate dehydratase n=1 Tax=Terribacillus saccharophilus TaxID=361277 RepID=UPI0039822A40
MNRLMLINGPNLNLLGTREPGIYGSHTLADVVAEVQKVTDSFGYGLEDFQSNHEGALVDKIQEAGRTCTGIILNAAAYTHTSIAIRDAIASVPIPVLEVHISNIHTREEFRHHSMLASVCKGQVVGLGIKGYRYAALALLEK